MTVKNTKETDRSALMNSVLQAVEPIAVSDLGILLAGEKGTGKKWLARLIHRLSGRASDTFSEVRCYGTTPSRLEQQIFGCETVTLTGIQIVRGVLERSAGGTVFFDRISEMPLTTLAKIVRALEHRSYRRIGGYEEITTNVRAIASVTGVHLESSWQSAHAKRLMYRLAPVVFKLPPLRERKKDVLYLMEDFVTHGPAMSRLRAIKGISCEAMRLCLLHDWPGNITELKECLEYAAFACKDDVILKEHLPPRLQKLSQEVSANRRVYAQEIELVERLIIEHALSHAPTKREAAEQLGMSVKTLSHKLNRYSLDYHARHAR